MTKYRVIDIMTKTLIYSTDNAKYAHEEARKNVKNTGNITAVCKTNFLYERVVKKIKNHKK